MRSRSTSISSTPASASSLWSALPVLEELAERLPGGRP